MEKTIEKIEKFWAYAYHSPDEDDLKNLEFTPDSCEIISSKNIGKYSFHYLCEKLKDDKNEACSKILEKVDNLNANAISFDLEHLDANEIRYLRDVIKEIIDNRHIPISVYINPKEVVKHQDSDEAQEYRILMELLKKNNHLVIIPAYTYVKIGKEEHGVNVKDAIALASLIEKDFNNLAYRFAVGVHDFINHKREFEITLNKIKPYSKLPHVLYYVSGKQNKKYSLTDEEVRLIKNSIV